MAKHSLVIVESPAKAKTIGKYLGKEFEVKACMGHLRDLPKSTLGVDLEHDFEPVYKPIKGKEDIIADLKKSAKSAEMVYLATDPDREGEAISWHLKQLLNLPDEKTRRVTFNEITKNVVQESIREPRDIDQKLVDAQQARRILDRIVGYELSPLLWKKIRRGLSAGRVQSVATRLVAEREEEIRAFVPQEYWTIEAELERVRPNLGGFKAQFYGREKKMELRSREEAEEVVRAVSAAPFSVTRVKRQDKLRNPAPPFTTSTLQQEASRKLGFTATRTMRAAQTLYEGMDIAGHGTMGLITYMRTDSLRVADEAVAAAKEFIAGAYGEAYVCGHKRTYKSKSATAAQDAHEAIRPTVPSLTPDEVEKSISGPEAKLYRLIWSRFIASQMADCEQATVAADIAAGAYTFKASGYTVTFDGFSRLYEESADEKEKKETALPPLSEGDVLKVKSVEGEQKFTQPPARYTEASLIKALEENGIGRPSTYAPIITTIIDRDYVERQQKKLVPTRLGRAIDELMEAEFPNIVDVHFSAQMEQDLDRVESGKADWHKTIDDFYKDFSATLEKAEEDMKDKKIKVPDEETDEVCELCGRKMVIKTGRYGKFLACPGFPECKNTRRLVKDTGGLCPKCGSRVLLRRSKKGRVYYGCEKNPACDFMTWNEPTAEKCPQCGSTLFKKGGRSGLLVCEKEGCGYSRSAAEKKE